MCVHTCYVRLMYVYVHIQKFVQGFIYKRILGIGFELALEYPSVHADVCTQLFDCWHLCMYYSAWEFGPFWEAIRHVLTQGIPRFHMQNLVTPYRVQKNPLLESTLSQINQIKHLMPNFSVIHFNIIHQYTFRPSKHSFLLKFWEQNYVSDASFFI